MDEVAQTNTGCALWATCKRIAAGAWIKTPPSPQYADRVARLLWGTAAHESGGFRYRRQIGFGLTSTRGGWGLFQVEHAAATDVFYDISKSNSLTANCVSVLSAPSAGVLRRWSAYEALHATAFPEFDDLSCLIARVYFMTIRESVPATPGAMAVYWDDKYNRNPTKGFPDQWLRAYNTWGARCGVC